MGVGKTNCSGTTAVGCTNRWAPGLDGGWNPGGAVTPTLAPAERASSPTGCTPVSSTGVALAAAATGLSVPVGTGVLSSTGVATPWQAASASATAAIPPTRQVAPAQPAPRGLGRRDCVWPASGNSPQ